MFVSVSSFIYRNKIDGSSYWRAVVSIILIFDISRTHLADIQGHLGVGSCLFFSPWVMYFHF